MSDSLRKRILEALLTEKDNRQKILNTQAFKDMGVTEEMANWAHRLNDKLSIWIVDSALKWYKGEMQGRHDRTPINEFYPTLTNTYEKFFEAKNDQNTPPINPKDYDYEGVLELVDKYGHIRNWLDNPDAEFVDLRNVSWDEAFEMANQFYEGVVPQGEVYDINKNSEIIHRFGDGFYWALTKYFFNDECRSSMGHCGTADHNLPKEIREEMWLYHLRKGEEEFLTFDWHPRDKYVRQAKGKQNTKPKEIYYPYIVWLLENIDIKLDTPNGWSPKTNFHLGDLKPEIAAKIFMNKPDIMDVREMLKWTPEENKGKLVVNLIKDDNFLLSLVPNKFFDYLGMVSGSDVFSMIGAVLKSPEFFKKMNMYTGYLTYTIENLLKLVPDKDKLIKAILEYDGMIDMLDTDGAKLLASSHSDPDYVLDLFDDYDNGLIGYVDGKLQDLDVDYDEEDYYDEEPESPEQGPDDEEESGAGESDEEEVPVPVSESHRRRITIIKELRGRFGKLL